MDVEKVIDYIVNHKNNLNGNILIEALEGLNQGVEPALPTGFTPNPGPNPGGGTTA